MAERLSAEKISDILGKHAKWWRGEIGGARANLRDADLSDANLRDADLSGADLRGADLSDANLRDADLSGADLSDADLSDANLRDADLSGADLSDANLRGGRWTGSPPRGIVGRWWVLAWSPSCVQIGCTKMTPEEWLGPKGDDLARRHGVLDWERAAIEMIVQAAVVTPDWWEPREGGE